MLRVAQVSFHADFERRSGAELLEAWPTLHEVAAATARAGCEVTVVQAAHRRERIERDGVLFRFERVGVSRARGSRWLGGIADMIAAVGEADPDVIHVHSFRAPVQTALLQQRFPAAPLLMQDHMDRPGTGLRRRLQRWGFRRIAGASFTAAAQAEPFFEAHILRAGVPVFDVVEGSTAFGPGEAAELAGDPCVVWVGRLDRNKDPLTMLSAVEQAAASLPRMQVWCVYSEAPLETEVRRRLELNPLLAGRVHLLGTLAQEQVARHLRAADLFVSASRREGSGYALIEALACGVVPVVTDIPPFRRITGGGAVGGLFPPGDAPAMARLLVGWAGKDRALWRRVSRRHFEESLSYDAIGRQLYETYRALLEAA